MVLEHSCEWNVETWGTAGVGGRVLDYWIIDGTWHDWDIDVVRAMRVFTDDDLNSARPS